MSRPTFRSRPFATAAFVAALALPCSWGANSLSAAASAGVLATTAASADGVESQRSVRATSAWVTRPAEGRLETTAYAVVENGTMYDVYVVGAETDSAAAAELRAVGGEGATTAVTEVPVPAFGELEMSPKGVHIALKNLKTPLKAGDTVTLVLALDSGERLTVTAPVK